MVGGLKALSTLSERALHRLESKLVWVLPAVCIPVLRYMNDTKETRNQLFVRDFSTYLMGMAVFFTGKSLVDKSLKKVIPKPHVRNFTSFVIAIGMYIAYSGIGAVRLSRKLFPSKTGSPAPALSQSLRGQQGFQTLSRAPLPVRPVSPVPIKPVTISPPVFPAAYPVPLMPR